MRIHTSTKVRAISLAAALLTSSYALAQQDSPKPNYGGPEDLYQKLGDTGTGGAAPKRDLTGFWAGRVAQKLNEVPPMTPWGQEQFRLHKSNEKYPVADSNDPIKGCDPLGFPRSMLFMTRGIAFAQIPGKMIQFSEYNRVWREIWTDGRELPKNAGSDAPAAPDSRWYGYSVGRWEDDYTFVANTVGTDERTWLDNSGHPHSAQLHVEERYRRVSHNSLEVTITIDDPKTYTKPFVITNATFTWIPQQDFPEEELCAPSEQAEYLKLVGEPAAHSAAPNK